jgi:SAM-dependent methyltransferase
VSGGTFEPLLGSFTLPPTSCSRDPDLDIETRTWEVEMAVQERSTEAFIEQAMADLAASYGGVMISIGHKLGLYRALAGQGPVSSYELAARTGCEERYVREWLNSQVAGGYLAYHDESETYELPSEHVPVLVDEDSPVFLPPAFEIPASMWFDQERTLEAFRTGAGIPWADHDERLSCGVAVFYRNAYRAALVPEWLPALNDVVEKLERGARVADVGCGHGHSTVLMASAFEQSRFVGIDTHDASLEAARANAEAAGVAERVEFRRADAGSYPGVDYDLICFFDCLHDLGDPVGAARRAYEALADDGTLMVVEPFAGDAVSENLGPVGRLYYSASTAVCVPHSRSEEVGLALGAQAGPARLADVFREAGFRSIRTAYETPFNIVLEVRR